MTALRRHNPVHLLLLIVAALALRILVPAGYMPVADEHGLTVRICSGSGPVSIEIDPGSTHPGKQDPRDPCPFGLAAGAALDPPHGPALPSQLLAPAPQIYPGLAAARLTAWRALRPPARGPPAFA